MIIKIGYEHLFVPHTDGIKFLECLAQAQTIHRGYSDPTRIKPLGNDKIEVSLVTPEEYDRIRIASLLNIPLRELDARIEQETNPEPVAEAA